MELGFLIPILFAVVNKSLAAVLVFVFLQVALRLADKQAGIVFSSTWRRLKHEQKTRYLCVRMVCITVLFCFVFTFT